MKSFIVVSGIFFLIAAILKLGVHILLGSNAVAFLRVIYYISIFADVFLFMGALFLMIAGSNYNKDE